MFNSIFNKLRLAIGAKLHLYRPYKTIYNLNLNPLIEQKRVALVFLLDAHTSIADMDQVTHPNMEQHYFIIQTLLKHDCIIDVFDCRRDVLPYNFPTRSDIYDIIIGFGEQYLTLCKMNPNAKKILYVTENAPWVVDIKFAERQNYYKERYGKQIYTIARKGLYSREMFEMSDIGIVMSGPNNIREMKRVLPNIKRINVNAIKGLEPVGCDVRIKMTDARKHFLWFGSGGLIHKGLDILIDAFRQLPDCYLDIYGAPPKEIDQFDLSDNVVNHGVINVNSQQFLDDVVAKHAFVVSLSCSEGMMSGIATCMMYGLIPISTKESGYDDCPYVINVEDWHVDNVVKVLKECSNMPVENLNNIVTAVKTFANQRYMSVNFAEEIDNILLSII